MGGRNGRENGLTQPLLAGLEAEKPEETELANCLVLSRPEYKDSGKKQEWTCSLHAEPSIFQPETDMELIASASSELATLSQKKSLKPGTGETQTVNRLALTQAPQMVVKEKRVSTTVYEQRKRR